MIVTIIVSGSIGAPHDVPSLNSSASGRPLWPLAPLPMIITMIVAVSKSKRERARRRLTLAASLLKAADRGVDPAMPAATVCANGL
jgi:hypothetical protein